MISVHVARPVNTNIYDYEVVANFLNPEIGQN